MHNPEIKLGKKVEVVTEGKVVDVGYVVVMDNSGPCQNMAVRIFSSLHAEKRTSKFFFRGEGWFSTFIEPETGVPCYCPGGPYYEIRLKK